MELLAQITRISDVRRVAILIVLMVSGVTSVAQADQLVRPTLSKIELSSKGTDETVVDIAKFGRYAIIGESEQKFRMRVIDRMTGPNDLSGPRRDMFLDRGDYKVVTTGSDKNTAPIAMKVVPFAEMNKPVPPRLLPLKLVTTELNDFEQRSFWVELDDNQQFNLRVAGRTLTDVSVWREGKWLEKISTRISTITPKEGEPMLDIKVAGRLGKGLYLVTLYGGAGEKWANGEPERNLVHLQWGIPLLDPAGRQHRVASPFGEDRFRISGWVDHIRLELPKAEPAELRGMRYSDGAAYSTPYSKMSITKKSRIPAVDISLSKHDGEDLVVVQREAGKPYVLEHFFYAWNWRVRFDKTGHYWIGGVQSGDTADNIDSTAILTRDPRSRKDARLLVAHKTVALRRDSAWRRSFNLHGETSLHMEVKQRGKYTVTAYGDIQPNMTILPFLAASREKLRPKKVNSAKAMELDAGFYILTLRPTPENKGIADLAIQGRDAKAPVETTVGGARFTKVKLDSNFTYRLNMNRQPDVVKGLVVRSLPIELAEESLPVTLAPGEVVEVPVAVNDPGRLTARSETGQFFVLSYDKGMLKREETQTQLDAKPGENSVYVKNISGRTQLVTLAFTPTQMLANAPLPAFDPKTLDQLPAFDVLTANKPSYIDLERNSSKHYLLKVEKPALYRVESSGLLHTHGTIRTRVVTSLSEGNANGVGRNFLVQSYLRKGDYQVTVNTQGQSKGHLGVRLNRTALHMGGELSNDIWARQTLKAGKGLEYRFTPKESGRYELSVTGLERYFRYRLEDGDGWPLAVGRSGGAHLYNLVAGETYRLIVRPGAIEARVVTRFMHIKHAPDTEGHGPHKIVLNDKFKHTWVEPEEGKARVPDVWTFNLHAKMPMLIRLTNGMVGQLYKVSKEGRTEVAVVSSLNLFDDTLDQGDYELHVKSFRPNNMAAYEVHVSTSFLVPGQKKYMTSEQDFRFAVGREGLVELSSMWIFDLRAALYRYNGTELEATPMATNDDRPDDWNFLIARNLTPGNYLLRVRSVGTNSSLRSLIQMYVPEAKEGRELAYGDKVEHTGSAQYVYPLAKVSADTVGLITASSASRIGLAVEQKTAEGWVPVMADRGFAPRAEWQAADGDYRVRVWPLDRTGSAVTITTAAANAINTVTEAQLAKGIKTTANGSAALLSVSTSQPGVFITQNNGLRVNNAGTGLRPVAAGLVPVLHGEPLLVSTPKAGFVTAERVLLGSKAHPQVQLDVPVKKAVHLDLDTGAFGPRLIVAESRLGQPGLILDGVGSGLSQNMGVSRNSAAAVALSPASAAVRVVSAESYSLPVDLRQVTFPAPKEATLAWGANDFTLAANAAYRFTLPKGTSLKHINLPAGTAAVLQSEGLVVATLWSGNAPLSENSDQTADELYIVSETGGQASASFAPRAAESSVLTMQLPYQRSYSTRGSTQVSVRLGLEEEKQGLTLRAFGAVEELTYISDDGMVQRGNEVSLRLGGTVVLRHAVGPVLLVLQGGELRFDPVNVTTPPAEIQLAGPNQDIALNPSAPTLLHLRSEAPAVALIERDGPEQVEVFAQGVNLYTYIPAGSTKVRLLPLAGESLSGTAQVLYLDAIRIKEGLGDSYQLGAGQVRLFQFTTTRKAKVGVGVNASSDVVTSRLYDAKGNTIGTGVVQMHELEAGEYFMAIEVPADAGTITVRPAVVNLNPADLGPPAHIRKEYMPR